MPGSNHAASHTSLLGSSAGGQTDSESINNSVLWCTNTPLREITLIWEYLSPLIQEANL